MSGLKVDRKGRLKESEASVQRRIVDYLEAKGWLVFQNRSGFGGKIAAFHTPQQAGSPDLYVWGAIPEEFDPITGKWERAKHRHRGVVPRPIHFAVECKRKGEQPSQEQLDWAQRYTVLGHLYILADDVPIIERTLREKGWL